MTDPIMQFFAYSHLPPRLQDVSRPFGEMAAKIVETLPRNPERAVALRKLLESKDAAVRALLFKEAPQQIAPSVTVPVGAAPGGGGGAGKQP